MLELITGALVAIAAVALVLEPLVRGTHSGGVPTHDPRSFEEPLELEESQSPKVQALLALREIEFDRATGKLSDEDYTKQKQKYEERALEAIRAEEAVRETRDADTAEVDDPAERAVLQMRGAKQRECVACGVRPETGAVFCSRCGRSLLSESAQPRCWMCGAELESDAGYCGQCGFALSA